MKCVCVFFFCLPSSSNADAGFETGYVLGRLEWITIFFFLLLYISCILVSKVEKLSIVVIYIYTLLSYKPYSFSSHLFFSYSK